MYFQSKAIERYIARKCNLLGDKYFPIALDKSLEIHCSRFCLVATSEEQACLIDGVNELIVDLKAKGPSPYEAKSADVSRIRTSALHLVFVVVFKKLFF